MSVLGRAARILDVLAASSRPLSLADIAVRVDLPRSSVHRAVQALEAERFVVRAPNAVGYVLGPGLLKFGMGSHVRLMAANRPSLMTLAREVGENVDLAVFSGREVVVVDQVVNPTRQRVVTKVGQAFSLHASCIGKALLAQLEPDEAARVLGPGPLRAFTPATVVEPEAILAELPGIRARGLALDVEEHDRGIVAVATATVGPTGALQAVAVVMQAQRVERKWDVTVAGLSRVNPRVDVEAGRALRPR